MQKVYITGSGIISALGNNKEEAVDNIKKIVSEADYKSYLKNNFSEINFYSIKKKFRTQQEKFYSIIKTVIEEAILEARLSKEEAKDLHIFLGSTSMSISINEEANSDFLKGEGSDKIKEIGYGNIANFIEEMVEARHKSTVIQSACTSSSNAFSYAANLIKNNKIKRALIVGFELFNRATYEGFNSLMLLSPSGECKPLDKNSDGLVLGEACSAVVLDSNRASPNNFEFLSANSNFDNYSVTNSHPDGDVSFHCMKDAVIKAGIKLEEITCLKAHSTGSQASTLSEAKAIDSLFKHYNCATDVVSLKPFIGHTLGACGTNEIVLLCECVKSGFIPRAFGFKDKYDDVSFELLKTNKKVDGATILFNFIGFGGSNNSIILSNKESQRS